MIVKLLTEHHFGVSKLKRRLQRLLGLLSCQNVKLLEISCRGSIYCKPLMLVSVTACSAILHG